jgi:hypothetical protein
MGWSDALRCILSEASVALPIRTETRFSVPRQLCFSRLQSLKFTTTAAAVDIFRVTMNGFLDLPCEVRIVLQRTLTVGAVHLVVAAVAFKAMPVCLRIAGRTANCFKKDIVAVAAEVLRHKPSNKMMAAVVRVAELHRADGSAPAIAALESTSVVAATEVTRGVGTVGLVASHDEDVSSQSSWNSDDVARAMEGSFGPALVTEIFPHPMRYWIREAGRRTFCCAASTSLMVLALRALPCGAPAVSLSHGDGAPLLRFWLFSDLSYFSWFVKQPRLITTGIVWLFNAARYVWPLLDSAVHMKLHTTRHTLTAVDVQRWILIDTIDHIIYKGTTALLDRYTAKRDETENERRKAINARMVRLFTGCVNNLLSLGAVWMLPMLQRFRLARQTTPYTASICGFTVGLVMSQYVAGQLTKVLGFGPPEAQLRRSVGFDVQVSPELVFKIAPEIRPVVVALLSAAEVTLRWSIMMAAVVAQRICESPFGAWRVIIAIPTSICVRHVSKLLDDSDRVEAAVIRMLASHLSAAAKSATERGEATSEATGQTTIREIGRHLADSRPAFASALAEGRTFTAATPQLAAAFKDFSAALLGDHHPIPVLQSFANGEREQAFEAAFAVLQAQAKNTESVANAPPTKDRCQLMTWISKLHEHPTVHRGDLTTFEQVLIQAHRNVAYCGKDLLRFIDAHAQALILITTTPQSECVGEGGSAIVVNGRFAGVHDVALRFVWDDSTRALREMTLLHGMKKHTNLIMPLIVCRLSANCFVELQPLLPGAVHTVLRNHLGRPTMTEAESWSALGGLLTALQHLHQHGLAHNDVKPDNILAIPTGDPVMPLHLFLTDGEYIRPVADVCEAGTPAYLPVRTAKNKFDGAARDLFAFAVTWIELVCGKDTLAPLRFAKLSPLLQCLLLRLLDVTSNTNALASMSAELQGWPEDNCMPPARSISPDTHDSRCQVDIASSATTVTACVNGCSSSAQDTNVCRDCGMCAGCAAAMRFSAAIPHLAHLYAEATADVSLHAAVRLRRQGVAGYDAVGDLATAVMVTQSFASFLHSRNKEHLATNPDYAGDSTATAPAEAEAVAAEVQRPLCCPQNDELLLRSISFYTCDECGERARRTLGCNRCDYDICFRCVNVRRGGGQPPATSIDTTAQPATTLRGFPISELMNVLFRCATRHVAASTHTIAAGRQVARFITQSALNTSLQHASQINPAYFGEQREMLCALFAFAGTLCAAHTATFVTFILESIPPELEELFPADRGLHIHRFNTNAAEHDKFTEIIAHAAHKDGCLSPHYGLRVDRCDFVAQALQYLTTALPGQRSLIALSDLPIPCDAEGAALWMSTRAEPHSVQRAAPFAGAPGCRRGPHMMNVVGVHPSPARPIFELRETEFDHTGAPVPETRQSVWFQCPSPEEESAIAAVHGTTFTMFYCVTRCLLPGNPLRDAAALCACAVLSWRNEPFVTQMKLVDLIMNCLPPGATEWDHADTVVDLLASSAFLGALRLALVRLQKPWFDHSHGVVLSACGSQAQAVLRLASQGGSLGLIAVDSGQSAFSVVGVRSSPEQGTTMTVCSPIDGACDESFVLEEAKEMMMPEAERALFLMLVRVPLANIPSATPVTPAE